MQNGQFYNPHKVFIGIFIPNLIIEDKKLSLGAKITFGVLCQFAGKTGLCFPRQEVIAKRLGITSRQARTYLKELKKENYIKVSRQGQGKSNVYRFLWKKEWTKLEHQDRKDTSCQSKNDRKDSSYQDRKDSSYPIRLNRLILNRDPSISPLKGRLTKKSSLRKRRETKEEIKIRAERDTLERKKINEEVKREWETEVKPQILKEQIKKKEEDLNYEECCRLDNTKLSFIKQRNKDLRRKKNEFKKSGKAGR